MIGHFPALLNFNRLFLKLKVLKLPRKDGIAHFVIICSSTEQEIALLSSVRLFMWVPSF